MSVNVILAAGVSKLISGFIITAVVVAVIVAAFIAYAHKHGDKK